jgi:hypothetical protein
MRDLAASVHAGIGAAGATDFDRMRGYFRQRLLDARLHAGTGFQPLPAGKIRAVVFDTQGDAHDVGAGKRVTHKISRSLPRIRRPFFGNSFLGTCDFASPSWISGRKRHRAGKAGPMKKTDRVR